MHFHRSPTVSSRLFPPLRILGVLTAISCAVHWGPICSALLDEATGGHLTDGSCLGHRNESIPAIFHVCFQAAPAVALQWAVLKHIRLLSGGDWQKREVRGFTLRGMASYSMRREHERTLLPLGVNHKPCSEASADRDDDVALVSGDAFCVPHTHGWEVEPHRGDALRENGLIFPDPESSPASSSPGSALPFNSHFTTKSRNGSGKKIFWRWVPFFEAQKLQRFVNLGEATADERWAKYAFQKEGVVQFPPTETALMILLRRCGIDVEKFGTERYRSLRDFWLDLTAKESLLHMSGGKPLRLADSTVGP
eukprot:s760_g10.t1